MSLPSMDQLENENLTGDVDEDISSQQTTAIHHIPRSPKPPRRPKRRSKESAHMDATGKSAAETVFSSLKQDHVKKYMFRYTSEKPPCYRTTCKIPVKKVTQRKKKNPIKRKCRRQQRVHNKQVKRKSIGNHKSSSTYAMISRKPLRNLERKKSRGNNKSSPTYSMMSRKPRRNLQRRKFRRNHKSSPTCFVVPRSTRCLIRQDQGAGKSVLISVFLALLMLRVVNAQDINPINCPSPYVAHGNLCCGFVQCDPGHYVVICGTNFTQDKCHPCPSGTNLLDATNSYYIFPCLQDECAGDLVATEYRATVLDPRACGMRCRCNTEKNKCGLDPCKCQEGKCQDDHLILQQDCGCRPNITKNNIPDTGQTKILPRFTTNDITRTVTPLAHKSTGTVRKAFNTTALEGVITSKAINESNTKIPSPTWDMNPIFIGVIACLLAVLTFVTIVVGVVLCRRKQKSITNFNLTKYSRCQYGDYNKMNITQKTEDNKQDLEIA